jgi:hypothetical protein
MTLDGEVRDRPPRTCRWCEEPIPPGSRSDAIYCSTSHRQASHRAKVHRVQLETTAHPMRLAYADPPYMGLSERYYGDQPTFDGEVDHVELLSRLETYDGWALSCSSASIPELLVVVEDLRLQVGLERMARLKAGLVSQATAALWAGDNPSSAVRLAIWLRRRPPHPTSRLMTAYEGLIFRPARTVLPRSAERFTDVLADVDSRPRPTHPRSTIGMKPPRFSSWLFGLLGALPGDSFDDLYPGSGLVGRAWEEWSGG